MKRCKTCLFFDVRKSRPDPICLFLSQIKEKTFVEAYPICEHDGPAVTYYVTEKFGCVHHRNKGT